VTTATLIEVMETLLNKRGGYMNNDVLPPWSLLDNIPNWETGVIIQARDLARSMRNDFSRPQTQSGEDPDLAVADPQFSFDYSSWLLPSTDSEGAGSGFRERARKQERARQFWSDHPRALGQPETAVGSARTQRGWIQAVRQPLAGHG